MRPVTYNFINKDVRAAAKFVVGGDGKEMGLLAQEVEKIVPNAVLTDPDGKKLINYTVIVSMMITAINELNQEIETLKANK